MHVRNALPALPAFLSRPFAVHMCPHKLCYPRTVFFTPHGGVEGGLVMTFEEILDQAIAMLQRRKRVAYRTLQVQFHLDDHALEALKDELLYAQQVAQDEDGRVLIWTGGPDVSSTTIPCAPQPAPPGQPLASPAVSPPQTATPPVASLSLDAERRQ